MNNVLLSVIVPIYNAELYLERCINSILDQTYQLIEIILIDDGAQDLSGEICDRYAEKYPNIKVIHQENKGLVASRKVGVECAKGGAIAFVDADDWIESDMYAEMMDKFITYGVDVVTSGMIFEDKEKTKEVYDVFAESEYSRIDVDKVIIPNMIYSELDGTQGVIASLCNKIFEREVLREELQFIDERLTYGEDGAIVYPLIARSKNIYISHAKGYHYIRYDNSMVHSISPKTYEKIQYLNHYLQNRFFELGLLEILEDQIRQYITPFFQNAIERTYCISFQNNVYLFPYEVIPKGSRVIIYGAGVVGKCYYKELVLNGYAEVVGWIDQKEKQFSSVKTEKIEILSDRKYDYIVIAIEKEEVAMRIRDMLLNLKVSSDYIIWKKPIKI